MISSISDRKLIQSVASLWVDSGGDAEGLDWVYNDLKQAIQDEIDSRFAVETD